MLKVLFIKCLTKKTKALMMLNYLRYWRFTFVCLTMAIKQFRAFCAKFDLIASKLVPLFKTQNDVNEIKFYLNTTDKTTALRNLCFLWFFLSWLWCQLHWQNRKNTIWKDIWTCLGWWQQHCANIARCLTFVWNCIFIFVIIYVIITYSKQWKFI